MKATISAQVAIQELFEQSAELQQAVLELAAKTNKEVANNRQHKQTLLDYFAVRALPYTTTKHQKAPTMMAREAYQLAAAMLIERRRWNHSTGAFGRHQGGEYERKKS